MATTTKPMAKTTKATEKKRAPRSASRKSAENGDQKKHYRPAPSLPMQNEGMLNMAIKAARDAGKIRSLLSVTAAIFRSPTRASATTSLKSTKNANALS